MTASACRLRPICSLVVFVFRTKRLDLLKLTFWDGTIGVLVKWREKFLLGRTSRMA
ncbi:hypothetical protein [Bradyrhizobium elkanii]|uniref:hypothetical protein n=1 Tax=Bradyrhizobium elkanii TaxID=29448 RepID=UPI001BACA479|nr:hypothetical protein [Bradyrhizobium elkanii]MBR1164802.1 hypothetical protein [Bradyrhizobium elkanii]